MVVSGGDMANVPIKRLEEFMMSLLDIENIRDIRIATKGLMGIPQHFLQDDVKAAFARMGSTADERGVDIALHTHVNCAQQVTPLVGAAARMVLDSGFRDVRNQGVLLRGVNTSPGDLLELCFMLLDHAKIMPYYFYMCDMIPNAEHWRTSVAEAQDLQYQFLGYMPGFATPRVICDVPFVGKRWVHMLKSYDREKGISYWTKNYRTGIEFDDPDGTQPRVPVLRPDLHAARRGPAVVARPGRERTARRALGGTAGPGRARGYGVDGDERERAGVGLGTGVRGASAPEEDADETEHGRSSCGDHHATAVAAVGITVGGCDRHRVIGDQVLRRAARAEQVAGRLVAHDHAPAQPLQARATCRSRPRRR